MVALLPKGLDVDGCAKTQLTCAPGRTQSGQYWQALGEAWRIEITGKSATAPDVRWMTERPHYLDMRDVFARPEWTDGRFIVRNRLGKITYELSQRAA
ncbi:hypothetical protein ACFP3U_16230 [Kitasatospora misakiensis]|uniref:Uncharacterized protein n=1 Tax=Kitasatospora misakiensis TaxID=67330 RepID=A0ABW0X1X7_9ACTN